MSRIPEYLVKFILGSSDWDLMQESVKHLTARNRHQGYLDFIEPEIARRIAEGKWNPEPIVTSHLGKPLPP